MALLTSGVMVYSYYRVQLIKGLETRLVRWAGNILAEISKNPTRFQMDPQRYLFATTSNEFTSGGVLVQFMSVYGELRAKSPSLIYFHLPFSIGDDDVIKDVEIDDGTKLKVYQRLIVVNGQKLGYVVVGIPTTQSYHNLAILRNIMAVMTILSVIILGYSINMIVSHNIMGNHRRFLSFASYELRTPLAIIIGNAEIALKTHRAEDHEAALATIRDEAEWMKRLVANLLLIFRSHAGSEIITPSLFNFSDIVAEEVASLKRRYSKKTLTVHLPDISDFFADPDKVRQIVRNLLDNAAKYTDESGKIDLTLTITDRMASLVVKDDGDGMDALAQRHIFDAYYRLNYDDSDGVGLGLAIVKSIVEAHRGHILVTSAPGAGTSFTVQLPNRQGNRFQRLFNRKFIR
jgi:signal transduction histidine kinase